ncbi:MAG: hypothetical protein JSW08_01645 [archaeon]|nr:MAG: hypothetical protein JSW08_01645 [archaeon]
MIVLNHGFISPETTIYFTPQIPQLTTVGGVYHGYHFLEDVLRVMGDVRLPDQRPRGMPPCFWPKRRSAKAVHILKPRKGVWPLAMRVENGYMQVGTIRCYYQKSDKQLPEEQ